MKSYSSTILAVKNVKLSEKQKHLIGTGIKYPFSTDPFKGNIDYYDYDQAILKINQSLFMIFSTRLGERVNQPDFGSDIWKYLFDPLTDSTAKKVAREMALRIDLWEKRIILDQIVYEIDYINSSIFFNIKYTIISEQVEGNYVYPFSDSIRPVL